MFPPVRSLRPLQQRRCLHFLVVSTLLPRLCYFHCGALPCRAVPCRVSPALFPPVSLANTEPTRTRRFRLREEVRAHRKWTVGSNTVPRLAERLADRQSHALSGEKKSLQSGHGRRRSTTTMDVRRQSQEEKASSRGQSDGEPTRQGRGSGD